MPNPNRKLRINFNILLTDELDAVLVALAKKKGISKAHIVRQAIHNWHVMDSLRTPLCADGQQCRCPHAHIYPPSQPPPTKPAEPSDPAKDHLRYTGHAITP